jgi:hypothetical protein
MMDFYCVSNGSPKGRFSLPLIVREIDRTFQQEKFQEKTFTPHFCCCVPKGESKVKFFCPGDVYKPGDQAKI